MVVRPDESRVSREDVLREYEERLRDSVVSEQTGFARQSAEQDAARREIRLEIQRDISLVERNRDDFLRPDSDQLYQLVSRAAERDLRHARSQETYLDSRLLALSADMGSQQLQRLNTGHGAFDLPAFGIRLRNLSAGPRGADSCDFAEIGRLAAFISRRAPAVDFLLGPIQVQRRLQKRGPIQRIVRNAAEKQEPVALTEAEAKKYENQTTAHVHGVYQRLREAGGPIMVFEFIINPTSFSQTVENIFFLSFLVQQRRARIFVDENEDLPFVESCDVQPQDEDGEEERQQSDASGNRHFIFDITESQWKELVRRFHITKSYIPTRPPTVQP